MLQVQMIWSFYSKLHIFKPLSEESGCRIDSNGATRGATEDSAARTGPVLEATDSLQRERKDGMLQIANGKAVPVMTNCAALSDPKRTRDLRVLILRGEIGS
ncbi:hypothetical protein PoB_005543800 [Plakobranchus ocellatus]|uniref:Uncharacterized protein n=1 Tax=Plakobranchus ocellatus TaxID=259542 RepID=A0AAV4CD88_9GAST|nr:hypothetical protein PoB_005543800 [Plakobranchus ocellatus]